MIKRLILCLLILIETLLIILSVFSSLPIYIITGWNMIEWASKLKWSDNYGYKYFKNYKNY